MADVREELRRLYTTYNPRRLKDVDALLERFKGREHTILTSLRRKYETSASAQASLNDSHAAAAAADDGRNTAGIATTAAAPAERYPDPSTSLLHASHTVKPGDAPPPSHTPTHPLSLHPRHTTPASSTANATAAAPPAGKQLAMPSPVRSTTVPEWRYGTVSASSAPLLPRPAGSPDGSSGTAAAASEKEHRITPSTSRGFTRELLSSKHTATEGATASVFPALNTSSRSYDGEGEEGRDGTSSSVSARQREMQELLAQMTSVDVSRLAARVADLTRSTVQAVAFASAAAATDREDGEDEAEEGEGRLVPRLQWRHRDPAVSAAVSPLAESPAGAPTDISAVLQHTSVFIDHFSRCARRYVELARVEQRVVAQSSHREATQAPCRAMSLASSERRPPISLLQTSRAEASTSPLRLTKAALNSDTDESERPEHESGLALPSSSKSHLPGKHRGRGRTQIDQSPPEHAIALSLPSQSSSQRSSPVRSSERHYVYTAYSRREARLHRGGGSGDAAEGGRESALRASSPPRLTDRPSKIRESERRSRLENDEDAATYGSSRSGSTAQEGQRGQKQQEVPDLPLSRAHPHPRVRHLHGQDGRINSSSTSSRRTAHVRNIRRVSSTPSPTPSRPRVSPSVPSPLRPPPSTDDAGGSPPTCRGTTVSPRTSPERSSRSRGNIPRQRQPHHRRRATTSRRPSTSSRSSSLSSPSCTDEARPSSRMPATPPPPPTAPTGRSKLLRHPSPPRSPRVIHHHPTAVNDHHQSSSSSSGPKRELHLSSYNARCHGGATSASPPSPLLLQSPPPPPLSAPPPSANRLTAKRAQHHPGDTAASERAALSSPLQLTEQPCGPDTSVRRAAGGGGDLSSPRRIHTWWPPTAPVASGHGSSLYSPSCASLQSGDCVVLQPGVYYENLSFEYGGHVEVTSAYPGAVVVLRPASDLEPVLSVRGRESRVTLRGIVLVQGELDSTQDASDEIEKQHDDASAEETAETKQRRQWASFAKPVVPLLSVTDGAAVTATACHFYGAAGGGVVAAGLHSRVRLDLCLISLCGFAGVYVHKGASAEVTRSKIKKSEVGLRVAHGSFFMSETAVEDNTSDGVVVYDESMGVVEKSNVCNNGGNGIFLSTGAEVRVVASTIELNALYGVQRANGSSLHIKSSFVRDNGLLPINEETT